MVLSSLDLTVLSDAAERIFVGKQQGSHCSVQCWALGSHPLLTGGVHGMFPACQSLLLADEDPQPHPLQLNTAPTTALLALAGENEPENAKF